MKKNYLSKPKCIDKTIKFSDLSTISDFALNMVVEKKLSSLNMGLEVHNSYLYKIISYYNVSGETFVYFENGSLCRIINNTIIEFITCNCVPLLVEVIYEGERVPAAITDKGLYLLKSGLQRFSMPYGNSAEVYSNRVFVASDNNIYFSDAFNFSDYSMNLENAGYVSVLEKDGGIVKLICYDDVLLVICKKAIYKLSIVNVTDFKFERYNLGYLDILPDSIYKIQNQIFLVSNNKLCIFKDGTIIEKSSTLDKYLSSSGKASNFNQKYLLEIFIDGKKYLLVYDPIDQRFSVFGDIVGTLVDGGLVINNNEKKSYAITSNSTASAYWESCKLNLNNYHKKFLMEFCIYLSQDADISIIGDFGEKKYHLNQGFNAIKTYLYSKYFKITLKADGNILAKDIQLNYRIGEE